MSLEACILVLRIYKRYGYKYNVKKWCLIVSIAGVLFNIQQLPSAKKPNIKKRYFQVNYNFRVYISRFIANSAKLQNAIYCLQPLL